MSEHDPKPSDVAFTHSTEELQAIVDQQQPKREDTPEAAQVREQIRQTEQTMSLLMERLAGPIREGRWDSLLIDDRSARLPGLVVGGVMRRYANEHDRPIPSELFLAAGRTHDYSPMQKSQAIQDHLGKIKPALGDRTLLVTEYIDTGGSVGRVASALKAEGINFDVASVDVRGTAKDHLRYLNRNFPGAFDDVELFVGEDQTDYPAFYKYELAKASGVEKEGAKPIAQLIPHQDRSMVIAAREEVGALEDRLYNKYFS